MSTFQPLEMLHSQINNSVVLIEVEGDEVVNVITDGAIHDITHRIYQGLFTLKMYYRYTCKWIYIYACNKVSPSLHQFLRNLKMLNSIMCRFLIK
jgi:hypothetical protein